jgi:hypothetical protein
MKSILRRNRRNLALVIGNGVNRYGPAGQTNSWRDLLVALAQRHLPARLRRIPDGVGLTEFYDVVALSHVKPDEGASLQSEFCELMAAWRPHAHHRRIIDWAREAGAPVLTTNFDRVLADAGGLTLRRTRSDGFTDYYPWESYYGRRDVSDPAREFGVWHVNGMEHYPRSVRLGLTHYMGAVERARGWIHGGRERRLFSGKNLAEWQGAASWLQVVFNAPLLIFGLALDQDEVFLRWLLIERARYFKTFADRKKRAWYVHVDPLADGKRIFLEAVGVLPHRVPGYDDMYGEATWQ